MKNPAWSPSTAPTKELATTCQSPRSPEATKAPPLSIISEVGIGSARQDRKAEAKITSAP
jgi:hypothetical protein